MSASPLALTFGSRLGAYLTLAGDYRKHRQRLNKHIAKLRHDLNIVTKDTRNYKESEKTSSISPDQYNLDLRYGDLLLLLAERDTVHALEIKSMLELSGQKMSSYKRLMASKLKKAASTCEKILSVTQDEESKIKVLELHIYAALIRGSYAINKKKWELALNAFSVSRCGLELLIAEQSKEELLAEDALSKAFATEIIETLVDPSISLALSQHSGHVSDLRSVARKHCHDDLTPSLANTAKAVAAIDASFVQSMVEEEITRTVNWRAHEATLYNDELAYKLHQINKLDASSFTESNDYDSLYSQWSTMVELHQDDLAKNRDEDDMEKAQNGAILLTYLNYNLLFTRIKRDLLLINQLSSTGFSGALKKISTQKDVARLYASVIATVEELKDLPGVYNDEDLYTSLEKMLAFFTASRSIAIADAYAASNKLPETLKIYLQVDETYDATESYFGSEQFPYQVTDNAQALELKRLVTKNLNRFHTLAQFTKSTRDTLSVHVADNINKFPFSADLLAKITNASTPGAICAVLSKPVLFDVAFNYIGYGAGEEAPQVAQAVLDSEAEKKKGGFFGIFGRG